MTYQQMIQRGCYEDIDFYTEGLKEGQKIANRFSTSTPKEIGEYLIIRGDQRFMAHWDGEKFKAFSPVYFSYLKEFESQDVEWLKF